MRETAGTFDGRGKRFVIIVSRFNEFLTRHMLEACRDTLLRHGARARSIRTLWVPGAHEIPTALKRALRRRPHAAICLGCIIRGSTPHFDLLAAETHRGIAEISRETGIPVAYGVITAENLEQAIERAGTKLGNKGREAALAALEMANLFEAL